MTVNTVLMHSLFIFSCVLWLCDLCTLTGKKKIASAFVYLSFFGELSWLQCPMARTPLAALLDAIFRVFNLQS